MRYPQLKVQTASRKIVDAFMGYNHNLRIGDGEFFDMKNLTSDHFPVLSPRKQRGFYVKPASPQGLIAKDEICYVDGTDFVMGEDRYDLGLSVKDEDCPKQLVSMGAYVIIMPDKKYINTLNVEDKGHMDAEWSATGAVNFSLCTADGDSYENVTVSPDAPANPENLKYWIDTSSQPHTLKQYSATSETWVSIATTYVKIQSTGIGKPFAQYDGVTISGITADAVKSLNASTVVWAKGDDYIVVTGILDTVATQQGGVAVSRKSPVMDFVIESGNRLWGCRYGENNAGQVVNEIYASKLGDFKNWSCYMGVSTDSYAASLGSDGEFTGAITFLGYPMFFKESCVHKIYGRYPANFQIQDTACRGVQRGCHGSLAIVNETLFYKARSGICAFDGSLPVEASYALGKDNYFDAVGGAIHNKYYVSMRDVMGGWHLFVYDTAKNLWHKEDDLHASGFCASKGELYAIDAGNRNIITMNGSGEKDSAPVQWMVETGNLGINSPDMKYLSRITLRMMLDRDSKVEIYAQYDMSDEWLHICTMFGTDLTSFNVPIRPRRTDHFRLRLIGEGEGKIYSITKTIEQGSDIS